MNLMLDENIKKLRLSKHLNQVEFARIIGVSKQCVSNWENDNVVPYIEMLNRMADFFGVSTDYLLGRCSARNLDVSNLSDEQIANITFIIKAYENLNKSC